MIDRKHEHMLVLKRMDESIRRNITYGINVSEGSTVYTIGGGMVTSQNTCQVTLNFSVVSSLMIVFYNIDYVDLSSNLIYRLIYINGDKVEYADATLESYNYLKGWIVEVIEPLWNNPLPDLVYDVIDYWDDKCKGME